MSKITKIVTLFLLASFVVAGNAFGDDYDRRDKHQYYEKVKKPFFYKPYPPGYHKPYPPEYYKPRPPAAVKTCMTLRRELDRDMRELNEVYEDMRYFRCNWGYDRRNDGICDRLEDRRYYLQSQIDENRYRADRQYCSY